eukprot:7498020-Pyramimonas_sp.AAC.1
MGESGWCSLALRAGAGLRRAAPGEQGRRSTERGTPALGSPSGCSDSAASWGSTWLWRILGGAA